MHLPIYAEGIYAGQIHRQLMAVVASREEYWVAGERGRRATHHSFNPFEF